MHQEKKPMRPSITAVVPVYNEEKFLEKSIERLLSIKSVDFVYIIDDCSTDDTPNILKKLVQQDKRISLYRTSKNSGKGTAITSVKKFIKTDYVIIHDADLEYYPNDIELMVESIDIQMVNLVLGSRFRKDKKKQIYYRTYYANKFLSFIFSVIYGSKFTDIATCYKLMPAEYFKTVPLNETGFSIEVELLAKFIKTNKNYVEVPINYTARSYKDGKKIKFIDGFKYLIAMIRYRF